MILHRKNVEQVINRDERSAFVKELVVVRFASEHGDVPLAMVRKRSASSDHTLAPVLLVHGYGQNRYAWHLPSRSFSNYLAHAGFDVFNLDLRGHGRSRHLGARRPGCVTDFVREDLPAAIREVEHLSGRRGVYLVGHSLGGLISYATAASMRESVRGIVTLGSPYLFTRGSWALRLLGDVMLAVDRKMHLGHGALPLKGWGEAVRLARVFIESPMFPLPIRGFSPGSMEPNILAQHMSLAMDAGSITVLRNMFLTAAESRASNHRLGGLTGYASAFEELDLPLLVIAGSKDDLAPPESVVPAFERSRSTNKSYRVFPRGHIDLVVGREAPLSIWPLVEAWLRARVRAAELQPRQSP
jgi:polyhydroxyalkanoate synthase subunit PhaC